MDYKIFLQQKEANILPPLKFGKPVILASASPRRKELMQLITNDFEIVVSGAEENVKEGFAPEELPEYFAELKATSVSTLYPDRVVIGCDTAVFLNGKMLGKPKDEKEAREMLVTLSGNTHKVISGVCITDGKSKISFSVETLVTFKRLTDSAINEYIASGEPFDKAGAYGIQGAAFEFVQSVQGSCYNVIGFPIVEIREELFQYDD